MGVCKHKRKHFLEPAEFATESPNPSTCCNIEAPFGRYVSTMLTRFKALINATTKRPTKKTTTGRATRWLVLQQGANPSTDYYIRPLIAASGLPADFRHIDQNMPQATDLQDGTRVVIVRYLTPAWACALREHYGNLAEVIYFMDDNLLNPSSWQGLPADYRKKLDTYCWRMRKDIRMLANTYWGSTPTLCSCYSALHMQHIPPQALAEDVDIHSVAIPAEGPVHIFYHGSASHLAEIKWLLPIMETVLTACPRAHFEIIGDHSVNKLYRNLPRTRILHPMSWPNYLAHCRSMRGHIGLVPLLPGPFNEMRAHIKVFDIARCGAMGLYADIIPYNTPHLSLERLPMRPEAWVARLIELCR